MPDLPAPEPAALADPADLELRVRRLEQVLAALEDCAGIRGPDARVPRQLELAIRDFMLELMRTRARLTPAR
jgi:hypothetical protein